MKMQQLLHSRNNLFSLQGFSIQSSFFKLLVFISCFFISAFICQSAIANINYTNGNNFEQETDLIFSSPFANGFAFQRYYNSQSTIDSSIGYGWSHSYDLILYSDFNDSTMLIKIKGISGKGYYFEDYNKDDVYDGYFGENSTIVKDAENNFIWTKDNGTIYKFEDTTGLLLSITDKHGNIQALTYNANNLLDTITDESSNSSITLHYNVNNKIDHISGPVTQAVPDGVWVSYTYDSNGNLIGVQYADDNNGSPASGYEYLYEDSNDTHNITSKKDLTGTVLSAWIYNTDDQVIENTNTKGNNVVINYDNPEEVSVTDGYGVTSIYHIAEYAGLKKIVETSKPNGCSACTEGIYKTDFDETTGLVIKREYFNGRIDLFQNYDSNQNPETIIYSSGSPEQRIIHKTYHPQLSTPLSVTEKSVFADASNPDRNKIIIYDYDDPDGQSNTNTPNENPSSAIYRMIEQGFTQGENGQVIAYEYITAMDYNNNGQVLSIDGPWSGNEDTTTYTYDPLTGDLNSITNPLTGTTTFTYDAAGNISQIIDINNIETTIVYDARNRPVNDTIDSKISAATYTASGLIKNIVDRDGRTNSFEYNPKGLLEKITDPFGDYQTYIYDANANLIDESIYSSQDVKTHFRGYDFGDPASNSDLSPGKPWKSVVRNKENTADLETVFQYRHGNVSSIADPADGQTDFIYDVFNRVINTTQKISGTQNAITSYTYDTQGNLISVVDANSNQTSFTYDDKGRLVKEISPDTGTKLYTYDAFGNLLSKTANDGRTTEYTYDTLGRITSIQFDDNTQDIIYLYDEGINGMGRLTGISDAICSYSFDYDTLGNLVHVDKTIDGKNFATTYTYDSSGNILTITYPDGRLVEYGYDIAGRINGITTTKNGVTQVLADAITYLPFGPIQTLEFGNNLLQTKTFDLQYRPSSTTLQNILDLTYGYDPAGNIATITDGIDANQNLSFSYDNAHRLTGSSGNLGEFLFTYDPVGNRLSKTLNGETQTYQYLTGSNLLDSITNIQTTTAITYDDNGNTKTKGDYSYIYSQNNRLIEVQKSNAIQGEYVYNYQNQRVSKTSDNNTTLYHYDLYGNLIAESDTDGNISKSYIYLGNQRIAVIEATPDQTFTVTVQTDNAKALDGVRVYVFNENNAYTGIYAITDNEGNAVFEKSLFDAENYKFRADYLNEQFWSSVVSISANAALIEIEDVHQSMKVIQNSELLAAIKVYLFDENNTYLGLYGVTDETGTVWFDLPAGHQYKFRADILGGQFFSDLITIGSEPGDIVVDSQGGTISFNLTKGGSNPLVNVKTYLFSSTGQYLGLNGNTNGAGNTLFNVPNGSYKIRCDYLGYQFWSSDILVTANTYSFLEIPHQDVTINFNKTFQTASSPIEGAKIYLFTESGSYQSVLGTTDSSGIVTFNVPQKPYKIRADYLSQQYWSDPFTWADETITVSLGTASLTVTNQGSALSDINVYAFNESGTYLGINGTTDSQGRVSFTLPQGTYKFRADWMNNQYWSTTSPISKDDVLPIGLSTGGGTIELSVKKDAENILEGIKCYLFNSAGSYLGKTRTTDSSGKISFSMGDGQYKIRADYMGYQFWSQNFTIPDTSALDLIIPHEIVTITANRQNDTQTGPIQGLKAYLFTESGTYQGISAIIDGSGTVEFELPQQSYKVRIDYLSSQYWSNAFVWSDQTIAIEEGEAKIEVRQNTMLLENINVYAFTEQNQYLGMTQKTGVNGQASFNLPQGTYKFRADHLGSQYWATQVITPHQTNNITIDTQGALFDLTIQKEPGYPIQGIKVYAFSSAGTYLGLNEQTNDTGQVTFDLPEGNYKFRADYLGYQFWTQDYTIPEINSSVLTIPHQDVEIAVNGLYNTSEPIQGVKVYLFTASGSYQGKNKTTDTSGKVIFNLPDKSYKVRADFLGEQYWTDAFASSDTSVTIDHAIADIHVTQAGSDITNARVYLFKDSGAYLGKFANTDDSGKAQFVLPVNAYKFRVDYNGSQYWSGAISLVAFQENAIALNLDLLVTNLTSDPEYGRFDGMAPIMEKALFASNNPEVPESGNGLGGHSIYFFINDHLGTPLKVLDVTGQVVWSAEYSPYGEAVISNNTFKNAFSFPGQYHDQETGLHYNWHRYYDPMMGRYLTPDPIGLAGGINPFVYANVNPINFIDPLGLDTRGEGLSVGFSVFGLTGNYTFQLVEDYNGDFGIALSTAGGGAAEVAGFSAMKIKSSTNANSINQLHGKSVLLGGGVTPLYGGYILEREFASEYQGTNKLYGLNAGVVRSYVDIHGVLSDTAVYNLSGILEKFFEFIFKRNNVDDDECKKPQ